MKRSKYFALSEFISYREVILFFLFFLLLMIVFFPKGRIENLLSSSEETNVDLTKKYLEALIRVKSPEHLKAVLLRRFAQIGSEEEVMELIRRIKKEDPKLALEVEYNLLKRKYFSGKENKRALRKRMRNVLRALIKLEDKRSRLVVLFRESVRMNFSELAYISSKKLAEITNSQRWYEEAFLYAVYTGKDEDAKKLIGSFKPTRKETYLILYYFLVEEHKYSEALNLLQSYIRRFPEEKGRVEKELMLAYFLSGKISEGERVLKKLLKKKGIREKRILILSSIRKLMEVGAYGEAKRMIERYLKLFKGDRKLLKEILRLSLQTGDPKFAARVAEEILKDE